MSAQVDRQVRYNNILVATDFSESSRTALKAGIWLASRMAAKLTLAHTLPDIRNLVETATYKGKLDFLYGEGSEFYQEVCQKSERKLREMISQANCSYLEIHTLTLLGSAHLEITRAVQQYGFDLVIAGTRGLSDWQRLFIGSTASRLVQKCPSSVWIVKGDQEVQPKTIIATTDFSDVSRKAVFEGLRIAKLADAEFHLLHTIDSMDVPDDILALASTEKAFKLREIVNDESKRRFDEFAQSLNLEKIRFHPHLSYGNPWQEIDHLANRVKADLIVMGTVGRGGLKGLLLGNTAEKVLNTCNVSVFTVKPDNFVSPVLPPFAPLVPPHPKPVAGDGSPNGP